MGNFSKSPEQVLADNRREGYIGIHIEQGVPLLDRDLNLVHDLIADTVRSVFRQFIGDGAPSDSEAFHILAKQEAKANDFAIGGNEVSSLVASGIEINPVASFLADGLEIRPVATTYEAQRDRYPELPKLTPPEETNSVIRIDMIYLDVWLTEATAESSDRDKDVLSNPDVGMATSVRTKLNWLVRVAQGTESLPPHPPQHRHYKLAQLRRLADVDEIEDHMITDLRQTRLTLADVERRLRSIEEHALSPRIAKVEGEGGEAQSEPGGQIRVLGANFSVGGDAPMVRFGDAPAKRHGDANADELFVIVPDLLPGVVDLVIENRFGKDSIEFTVLDES